MVKNAQIARFYGIRYDDVDSLPFEAIEAMNALQLWDSDDSQLFNA